MQIKITIIIATFNAASTLRCCLDSIVPQLTEESELIVIDGGSTDRTLEIVSSYGHKIAFSISERDKGIYDAWNKGIKIAKGEWLLFIGADDVLLPGAIDGYLDFIKEHDYTDYDFISSRIESVTEQGEFLQYTGKIWNYWRCRINMDVTHVASLTSKHYFNRVGLFNVDYKICGDYELLMRGGDTMKPAFNSNVVARMPIGGTSFSVAGLLEQKKIKEKIGRMSSFLSCIIFIFQLFLFYTYKIRHIRFLR